MRFGVNMMIWTAYVTSEHIPLFGPIKEAGFEWALQQLPERKRVTWPSDGRYPDATFDHLFVRGLRVSQIAIPSYDRASDHRPVVVDLVD